MDQATYQQWWQLHLRVARGESLSPDEQSSYDAGRREVEQEEQFAEAMDARESREELAALEKEHAELEKRRQQLDSQIAELESRLGEPARKCEGASTAVVATAVSAKKMQGASSLSITTFQPPLAVTTATRI